MRLVLAALSLAAVTGAAAAQGAFDPRDGWELYRRLDPVGTAACTDRDCWPRDGGMRETSPPGSFSRTTEIPGAGDSRLYYTVVGCGPDKRGCKALEMTYNYFPAPRPSAQTMARWNAANPACKVTGGGDLFGPTVIIPLTAATKFADIEAARRTVLACGPKFLATL
jgi:hypothetical protein